MDRNEFINQLKTEIEKLESGQVLSEFDWIVNLEQIAFDRQQEILRREI